jgi:hypothetical protein
MYLLIYDTIWAIDANLENGLVSCGVWEFLDGIYYIWFFYILLIRVVVFFFLNRKSQAIDKLFKKQKELADFKSEFRKLLVLQKMSKLKFIVGFSLVASLIHGIIYFIDWGIYPELIDVSFYEYEAYYANCYTSASFLITTYYSYALGALVILLAAFTRVKEDIFKIKLDYLSFGIFWMAYFVISNEIRLDGLTDEQKLYFSVYFWMAVLITFLAAFIIYPWLRYRRNVIPLRRKSKSAIRSLSEEIPDSDPIFFSKEKLVELLEDNTFFMSFFKFLEKEYCSESLLFWKSVRIYKNFFKNEKSKKEGKYEFEEPIDMDPIISTSSKEEAGKSIFDNFLSGDAVWQVNIAGPSLEKYSSFKWTDPDLYVETLFDSAEDEVIILLRNDPFHRFRQTDAFRTHFGKYREENNKIAVMEVIAPI